MKTLARLGAVLCFGLFSDPGLALMAHAHGDGETGKSSSAPSSSASAASPGRCSG